MQLALSIGDPGDEQKLRRPELVTEPPRVVPHEPEQLPLIRMLEVVTERIESMHAGQRSMCADLREIKASLPVQRRALSVRTRELHIRATWARRNGLCPCCQSEPVCTAEGRLETAEYDHWFSRHQNRISQTWLVCEDCNRRLRDTDFKASVRSAFESYQLALKPLLARQMPLGL